jgi:RNA polymerase sigma factor (TIGR02999 family)
MPQSSAVGDSLVPAVYHELRRIAHAYLRGERTGHTLQATALVHEAYIRLIRQPAVCADRGAFVGIAAHLMRQVLADYARTRRREKRGGKHRISYPSTKPSRSSIRCTPTAGRRSMLRSTGWPC